MLLREGVPPSAGRALTLLAVTAIEPAVGAEAGGTEVVITGARFTGASVTIGGNAATSVVVVNSTTIQCTTPAGTGTVDVVVTTPHGVATLEGAFEYSASPPATDLLFASDWGTALGTGSSAVSDGGNWNVNGVVPVAQLSVIETTGTDLPTANALRLGLDGAPSVGVSKDNIGDEIALGATRYWRWYQVVDFDPTSGDDLVHIPQMAITAGDIPYWDRFDNVAETTYDQQMEARYDNGANPYRHVYRRQLVRGTAYRIELAITRLADNFVRMQRRVYTAADEVLRFSDADFLCQTHGSAHSLADAVHGAEVATANGRFVVTQWPNSNQWMFVNPGESLTGQMLIAAFAVSDVTWCGVYVEGEGP